MKPMLKTTWLATRGFCGWGVSYEAIQNGIMLWRKVRMPNWTDQEKYKHAKEMAEQHWSYVQSVILHSNPDTPDHILELIKFHYITAGIHFYGHGWEDAKDDRLL